MIGVLVGTAGSALLFRGLFSGGTEGVLWAGSFDPALIMWMLRWGFYSLFQSGAPLDFWNANQFYPHDLTLAYSESLLGLQVFYAPLRFAGVSANAAAYLALAGITVVGTTVTGWCLARLELFRPVEVALLCFAGHFSLCVTNFLGHYQLFGFQLAPPILLGSYLYLTRYRGRDLLLVGVLFAWGVTVSMYLAPMLLVVGAVMSFPLIWRGARRLGPAAVLRRTGPGAILGTVLVLGLLFAAQIWPYLIVAGQFPSEPSSAKVVYSADPTSLFFERSIRSLLYAPSGYQYGDWERAYFPGAILLACLVLSLLRGALMLAWPERWKTRLFLPSSFIVYLASLFLVSWILSFGPFTAREDAFPLPFLAAAKAVPGLDSVRAPGRFGMLLGLPLGVGAVVALRSLGGTASRQRLAGSLLTIAIVVDSLPRFPVVDYAFDEQPYLEVATELEPGTPVIELPVLVPGDDLAWRMNVMRQMLGSTYHWGRLVVGYGTKVTDEMNHLIFLDRALQAGDSDVVPLLEWSRGLEIDHVLVHVERYPAPAVAQFRAIADREGCAESLIENRAILLLRLNDKPPASGCWLDLPARSTDDGDGFEEPARAH